jgi:ribonuclease HI
MCFDGALKLDGASIGVLFISPKGEQLKYVLQLLFKATNNAAEYEALIHSLRIIVRLGIKRLLAFGNYKVVIQQVNKDWECTKETMDAYCREIRKLEVKFYGLEFHHVPGMTTLQLTSFRSLDQSEHSCQQVYSSKHSTALQSR